MLSAGSPSLAAALLCSLTISRRLAVLRHLVLHKHHPLPRRQAAHGRVLFGSLRVLERGVGGPHQR